MVTLIIATPGATPRRTPLPEPLGERHSDGDPLALARLEEPGALKADQPLARELRRGHARRSCVKLGHGGAGPPAGVAHAEADAQTAGGADLASADLGS